MICLISLILISGCSSQGLKNTYNKMQKEGKEITSYNIDLRIYGTIDDVSINEMVKITKYNNDYKILVKDLNNPVKDELVYDKNGIPVTKESGITIYIKNGKTYMADSNNQYNETSTSNYNNPNIYLIGINNIKKKNFERKETIGNETYNVYEVVFDKDILNKVLKETPVKKETKKDGNGIIYINSDGYVYRIIYMIDNLTVNVNYYEINIVSEFSFPPEINNI